MKLSPRKREILKEVIDAYITTGEPVGSKALMEKLKTYKSRTWVVARAVGRGC